MRKKNIIKGSVGFLAAFFLLLIPERIHAALPQPFNFVDQLASLLPLFLLFGPISAVILSTMSKIWLLRGRLSVPWKVNPLEKLALGALGQSIVEFIFITLFWALFDPVAAEILGKIGFKAASPGVKTILHTAMVIPWYEIMATLSLLLLIQFLSSLNFVEVQRRYLKASALLSLILPLMIILIVAVRVLFFK